MPRRLLRDFLIPEPIIQIDSDRNIIKTPDSAQANIIRSRRRSVAIARRERNGYVFLKARRAFSAVFPSFGGVAAKRPGWWRRRVPLDYLTAIIPLAVKQTAE
jgi:hypothetical protein